jgi:ribonuclease HII
MLPSTLDTLDETEIIVGCDEVGRGCGAFSVCAAVVIWPDCYVPSTPEDEKLVNMIKDSKKLSAKRREEIAEFIKKNACEYAIASIDSAEIDKINILQATYKAMHKALDMLNTKFTHIVVDGNKFKTYLNKDGDFVQHTCIVSGDNALLQIAAASILAKVHRDNEISMLAKSDPSLARYGWEKNKGYLTKQHMDAIKEYGMTPYHRRTFIH